LYYTQFELSRKIPEKRIEIVNLNEEIEYSKKLVEIIKQGIEKNYTEKSKSH